MLFDNDNTPGSQDDNYVDIYSRRAILGFSIFPTPLFGGILLMLNLKAAGLKQAIYPVLIFSILYYIGTNIALNEVMQYYKLSFMVVNKDVAYLFAAFFGLNIIGGLILSQYFFRKSFPDDDYYPKSVAKPLLILVLIILFLGLMGF